MNEHSTPLPGSLQDRLRQGRFVMTAELAPPVSCDAAELLQKAADLKGLADAVNVTDGAGARAHMAALAAARLLLDAGTLPTGRKVGGKADFFIGAADMPIDPPAGWEPKALMGKVKSGAQFAQTQFCMDAAIVRRYIAALDRAGITRQLAVLIGVNPLRSAKSAAWMKSHLFGTIIPDAYIARLEKAADPAREGIAICVELIEELSTVPGVAGVHIMAPGNDAAIAEVIGAARPRLTKASR